MRKRRSDKLDVAIEVKKALEASKDARNNDHILIYAVMRAFGMPKRATIEWVLYNIMEGKLPTFATITRAKRKVVELYPELDCDKKVREMRDEEEGDFVYIATKIKGI